MKLKIAKVIVIDWVNLHHQIAVTKSIKLFTSFRLILGIGYEALEKDTLHLKLIHLVTQHVEKMYSNLF